MAGLGMGVSELFRDASPAIQRRRHLSGAAATPEEASNADGETCGCSYVAGLPIRPGSKTLISAKKRAEDFPGLLCETAQRASG